MYRLAAPSSSGERWGVVLLLLLVVLGCGCGRSVAQWTERGDAALRDGDLITAERAFSAALAKDGHHVPAIYGKAWALFVSGHADLLPAARQLFQRCIDYDPDYFGGYRGLGLILLQEEQILPAEAQLRKAYDKAPREPSVLLSLVLLYTSAGRLDEASDLLDGAIRLAPERGEFHRYRADIEMGRGRWDAALEAIERGREIGASGKAGELLLNEGEALVYVTRARALFDGAREPDDPGLEEALRALDAADSLLEEAEKLGLRPQNMLQRSRQHELLRERIRRRRAL